MLSWSHESESVVGAIPSSVEDNLHMCGVVVPAALIGKLMGTPCCLSFFFLNNPPPPNFSPLPPPAPLPIPALPPPPPLQEPTPPPPPPVPALCFLLEAGARFSLGPHRVRREPQTLWCVSPSGPSAGWPRSRRRSRAQSQRPRAEPAAAGARVLPPVL